MNDTFYEQLVKKKSGIATTLVKVAVILVVFALLFVGIPLLGGLGFILAAGVGFLGYYVIFPKLSVEYEYALANQELEIAAIYSKSSRKELFNFDMREETVMIVPKGSPKLYNHQGKKVYDFTSGEKDAKVYVIVLKSPQACLCIEPDEKMLGLMKDWAGQKFEE